MHAEMRADAARPSQVASLYVNKLRIAGLLSPISPLYEQLFETGVLHAPPAPRTAVATAITTTIAIVR